MGRHTTGAITVNDCLQLHVNIFTKDFNSGKKRYSGRVSWHSGSNIDYHITNDLAGIYLYLNYTLNHTENINYRIPIFSKLSNLGKGYHYYFICTATGRPCKILYLPNGSKRFLSRKGFLNRIYYPCQLSSRINLFNDRYWRQERQLKKLYRKHPKNHYRGLLTGPQKRIMQLEKKRDQNDCKRLQIIAKQLEKLTGKK